ncbi:MAG: hypothetical protein R3C52_05035 [Hyphomonadaceae bacterium]
MSVIRIIRLVIGVPILLGVLATPFAVGIGSSELESGGVADIFITGLMELGWPAFLGGPILFAFGVWLTFGRDDAFLRFSSQRERARQTAKEVGNSMVISIGATGLVAGVLFAMYAAIVQFWPDVIIGPRMPMTFGVAALFFITGGVTYALGRVTR